MCIRIVGRSAPPPSRNARASASERSISSSACPKSIGWIPSGQGGGSTTSFALIAVQLDVGDQAALRQQRQRVQRHAEALDGGCSSAQECPLGST